MASPFSNVFFFSFLIIHFYTVICAEYEVNGDNGWIVPKHDNRTYNNWASTNRFIVNDTIRKVYEYDKCQTSHPQFFSNNGDTDYKLDQPGLFYFISGATGHCQRGQKMHNKQATENAINNGAVYEFRWLVAVMSSILMLFFISAFG
ncbi:hypothetical protein V6Z11_D11G041400 [Gossypium hirsutum]